MQANIAAAHEFVASLDKFLCRTLFLMDTEYFLDVLSGPRQGTSQPDTIQRFGFAWLMWGSGHHVPLLQGQAAHVTGGTGCLKLRR